MRCDAEGFAAIGRRDARTRTSAASSSSSSTVAKYMIPVIPPSQLEEEYVMGTRKERANWFPVAFADELDDKTMIPFDLFNVPWVAFRDQDGMAGCIKDECAHRACPISLGKVVEGRVQCPYHGWEYTSGGECKKMPSIKNLLPNVYVDAAPIVERDGLLYVWAGVWEPERAEEILSELPPSAATAPPSGFAAMAEVTIDVPLDAPAILSRLMDVKGHEVGFDGRARQENKVPFTRVDTTTLSDDVFPKVIAKVLRGFGKPAPKRVEFTPACILDSTIGLDGVGGQDWNVHQTHVVLPSRPGKARVLYRLSVDFVVGAEIARTVGGQVWQNLAEMILQEQLEGIRGGRFEDDSVGEQAADVSQSYDEWMEEIQAPR
jgi:chlorophyllide a oxygenase